MQTECVHRAIIGYISLCHRYILLYYINDEPACSTVTCQHFRPEQNSWWKKYYTSIYYYTFGQSPTVTRVSASININYYSNTGLSPTITRTPSSTHINYLFWLKRSRYERFRIYNYNISVTRTVKLSRYVSFLACFYDNHFYRLKRSRYVRYPNFVSIVSSSGDSPAVTWAS